LTGFWAGFFLGGIADSGFGRFPQFQQSDFTDAFSIFYEPHDPLHGFERELAFRETHDSPTCECRLEVFFDVGQESLRPVVSALNPNATLDFDQCAARDVSEVGTPTATGVKDKFLLKGRAVRRPPEEREPGFQAGRGSFVAESESSHP